MNAIIKRFRDVLLSMFVAVLTQILRNIGLAATPWLAKYGLNLPELTTLNGLLLTILAAGIGAGLDWIFTRNVFAWIGAKIDQDPPEDAIGKVGGQNLSLWPLILACAACLALLAGCSQTPAARYERAAALVNLGTLTVNGAKLAGKGDNTAVEKADELLAQARPLVLQAHDWLEENPALADVPGAPCPPLEQLRALLPGIRKYYIAITVGLVPMDAPRPTTKPATQGK